MTLYQFQEKSCNISKFLTNREKLRSPTSVLQFNTRIIKNNLNLTILVFAGPLQSSVVVSVSVFRWQFLITYVFSVLLKFGTCHIMSQCGEFRVKNTTLWLLVLFWHFFVVFYQKNYVFIVFFSSFWWSIKFPQQNINQSETRNGDKKLSVKLYDVQNFTS